MKPLQTSKSLAICSIIKLEMSQSSSHVRPVSSAGRRSPGSHGVYQWTSLWLMIPSLFRILTGIPCVPLVDLLLVVCYAFRTAVSLALYSSEHFDRTRIYVHQRQGTLPCRFWRTTKASWYNRLPSRWNESFDPRQSSW